MRYLILLVFLMSLPVVSAAPVPRDRKQKTDLQQLQGRWRVIDRIDNG